MAIFFNGRKWVSPATMSAVNDDAMYNRGLSVGNVLALVGRSKGGEPHTAIRLGGPDEAREVLRGGEGMTAAVKAFDPSAQLGAPAEVVFVRVNPAEQASLTLSDGDSNTVVNLKSTDYGLYTDQIKVRVEEGTNAGFRLSTQLGDDYYTEDDVARNAFSVQYTGSGGAATMTISGESIVLNVDASEVSTIDLNAHETIVQVVDVINSVDDFAAEVLDGNGNRAALNGLDYVTEQDVTSEYTALANLQAVVDWFNSQSEALVTAERPAGVGAVPQPMNWRYLSGGSDGTVTNEEWSKAFDDVLQQTDVQFVVPLSADDSIHAMNDSHCAYMSTVARMERRGIVGTDIGTSDEDALEKAKALNSDRTSLVHIGYYDFNEQGDRTLYPAYMTAAVLGGGFTGAAPGTALTNKSFKFRGLERRLRNPTDTDVLITGGVLPLEDTPEGFKVVQSISTWLTNDNYNRVEVSTGVAVDFAIRSVREAVDILRGEKNGPLLIGRAIQIAESTLRELARPEPQGPGVLVGDEENPAYRGITARIVGDALYIDFQASPVIPANYIPVTMYAVPYSGTATA